MKNLIIITFLIFLVVSCGPDKIYNAYGPTTFSILVDQTTYEQNPKALEDELNATAEEIFQTIQKGPFEKFFSTKVKLGFIDGKGEHHPLWSVTFPEKIGRHNREFKKAFLELSQKIAETSKTLKEQNSPHTESWILEPVIREIKTLNRGSSLYIISDLMIVDNENNFERMKFSWPKNLGRITDGIDIHLKRIPFQGMPFDQIAVVEAWWKSTLNDDSVPFQRAYSAFAEKNTQKEIEKENFRRITNQRVEVSPPPQYSFKKTLSPQRPSPISNQMASSPSRRMEPPASSDSSSKNRSAFSSYVPLIKRCYKTSGANLDSMKIELKVSARGTVEDINFPEPLDSNELSLQSCLQLAFMDIRFPANPEGKNQIIRQKFKFAGL